MALQEMLSRVYAYIPDCISNYLPESILTKTILIGTSVGLVAYLLLKKRYKLPPGPRPLPLLGNSLFRESGNLPQKLTEIGKKYGDIFTIYIGPYPCIILNSLETIKEALLTKAAFTSDRITFFSTDQLLHNSEDIIFGKYGTGWKLRRKVAARALRLFMVSGHFNQKLEEAVSKTVAAMLKEKGAFDPKPYLFYTTLNIIAGMCFSRSYEYDDPEYWELLNNLEENAKVQSEGNGIIFENLMPGIAKLNLFRTAKYKKLEDLTNKFLSHIEGHVKSHRDKFVRGQINDFTDSLLQAEIEIREEGQENMAYFQPIHVVLTLFDIFLAGNDTSRMTLYWALKFIIATPGVQQKMQAEIDEVAGKDRYPTTDDRDRLSYSDAVLHEAMRLGIVAPLGVPHATTCDTTLGSYEIPKGATLFFNFYGLHYDGNFWENVDKFQPERFLDEDGKMAPKPDNWLPFSAGRRVCLGESLAKPELHLIIAALFQHLEISLEPGKDIDMSPDAKGFIIAPRPYNIVVKKRT